MSYWFGELPAGWRVVKLKHLCLLRTEKTDNKNNYVGLENIISGSLQFIDVQTVPEGENISFCQGDVLFGKLRPYLAKVWCANFYGCCSSEFLVMKPLKICGDYLKYALIDPKFIDLVNGSTFGTKMPRANWDFIGNQWIPVPPVVEQEKIARKLEEKTKQISALVSEISVKKKLLLEYRQSLITQAVTKGLNPDVKLRDSGVVWMGEIPQHWSVCAVKWLTDITSGGTPDRTNKEYWIPGIIPWVKTGELQNNTITESEEKISLLGMKNSAAKLFPVETLLIAMYGATRGMTGLLQIPATTNQACAALMIKKQENRIIPNYLQYVFMAGCDFVRQKAVGAGQPNLSLDLIANLKVPVPPFEEQELIVKRLRDECGRVDDTIVKVTDVISKLSEYRSSLIADVLAGKGMVKGVSHV